MNVTIYLPDDLGERVKKADLEVSRICQEALSREVENAEAEKKAKRALKMRRIEVEVGADGTGGSNEKQYVTKAFRGAWILRDFEFFPEGWNIPIGGWYKWSAALTEGDRIAVYVEAVMSWSDLYVYDSLDKIDDDEVPEEVAAAIAQAIGVDRAIELDI